MASSPRATGPATASSSSAIRAGLTRCDRLPGVIDRVGLLKAEHATERNVEIAYRHYRRGTDGAAHRAFVKRFCHEEAPVEMVGVGTR